VTSPRRTVRTREAFISVLFELLDNNDAVEWENDTAYTFLQALAAWLHGAEGFYKNTGVPMDSEQASWQLFADAIQAATTYE